MHVPSSIAFAFLALVLVLQGCKELLTPELISPRRIPGWQTVKPRLAFEMQLPPGMTEKKEQCIDLFCSSFNGNGISIEFMYGRTTPSLKRYDTKEEYESSSPVINGQPAKVIFYRDNDLLDHKYHGGVTFPAKERGGNRLTVFAHFDDTATRTTVMAIFESILVNK